MPTYEFTVALDRAPDDDDFDRIFEAGLDDTVPETREGRGVLNVAREARSMSEAIVSVVRDVERAGFHAVGVEDDDLVSLKTVARRTGRSYESVRLLASSKRGPGDFPTPLSGDGWALYSWALVSDWFTSNYESTHIETVNSDQRVLAAASLLLRARATADVLVLAELSPLLAAGVPANPSNELTTAAILATRLDPSYRWEPVRFTSTFAEALDASPTDRLVHVVPPGDPA